MITDSEIKQYSVLKYIQKKEKLKLITIGKLGNSFQILNHKIFNDFQLIKLKHNRKVYNLKINLYGSIQIKNLLMAILACTTCGLKFESFRSFK